MNNSKKKILEIIIIILISFSPLLSNPLKAALTLLLVIINLKNIRVLNKKRTLVLVYLLFIFIIGFVYDLRNIEIGNNISILNLYFPLCFILGFIISQKYDKNEYLYYLEKVIFITAIFSLAGVLVYTFLPTLVYNLPSYNYYHTNHKTAIIFNILLSGGGIISRNAGIAWEPGAFQFLLNLGVYSYIKSNKNVNIAKIIIYGIAIITTKSTAGFAIFFFITFSILRKNKMFKWIILLLIIVFSDPLKEEIIYQYNYKLFGSYAFESRLKPMMNAFKIGIGQPFGLGNSGYDLYYQDLGVGAWDSYGQILIRYGYGLLAVIIYFLIKILKKDFILFIIIAITLLSQGVWYLQIITPLYFMSINDMNKIKKEKLYENIVVN